MLDLTGNRVARDWAMSSAGLPAPKSPVWEWLPSVPDLRLLNRVPLSGHAAAGVIGPRAKPPVAAAWARRAFDDVLESRLPDSATWAPAGLTTLSVAGCGLTAVHLGGLIALTALDASGNALHTLAGTGIETCTALTALDMSNNAIGDPKCLDALGLIPRLRFLALAGNPLSRAKGYRAGVLWATRGCAGAGYARGLGALDGAPVGFEEVAAAVRGGARGGAPGEAAVWALALAAAAGVGALAPAGAALLVSLSLPRRGLRALDLAPCVSLVALDASENDLGGAASVASLAGCARLAALCLQGNPRLAPGDALRALTRATALRTLRLARNEKEAAAPAHLAAVLAALTPSGAADRLRALEGAPIPDGARLDALVRAKRLPADAAPAYRLHAAAARGAAPLADLCLAPDAVAPGDGGQYTAAQVTALLTLDHAGYTEATLPPLGAFGALRALNLCGNKLRGLAALGLDALTALEDLDVRDNALACPITELGALLQVCVRACVCVCVCVCVGQWVLGVAYTWAALYGLTSCAAVGCGACA